MNKKRMLKLADFLENVVPKHRFDLCIIAKENDKGEKPGPNTCGTAGCAIGWMPNVFPRLCQYVERDWFSYLLRVENKETRSKDFKAAEEIFDINSQSSSYLFNPVYYGHKKGKMTVAKRIRKFVEADGIPTGENPLYVPVES